MAVLAKSDLKVGSTYRAKKPIKKWNVRSGEHFNDRTIIYLDDAMVQYDGPSVSHGRHYPKATHEAFLAWAGCVVVDIPEADLEF